MLAFLRSRFCRKAFVLNEGGCDDAGFRVLVNTLVHDLPEGNFQFADPVLSWRQLGHYHDG